jgi:hypothetical protein
MRTRAIFTIGVVTIALVAGACGGGGNSGSEQVDQALADLELNPLPVINETTVEGMTEATRQYIEDANAQRDVVGDERVDEALSELASDLVGICDPCVELLDRAIRE